MKKALLVAVVMICVRSLCFAQAPSSAVNVTVTEQPKDLKTFEGTVVFVDLGDDLGQTKGRVTVIDDDGQKFVFEVITNSTTLRTIKGKECNLRGIQNGDKVSIQYTANAKNHKVAWSVKVIE